MRKIVKFILKNLLVKLKENSNSSFLEIKDNEENEILNKQLREKQMGEFFYHVKNL